MHLVTLTCLAELTQGGPYARERAYRAAIRQFPETIDPAEFEAAGRVSRLRVAPETMLRGYFRQANGRHGLLEG